MVNEDRADGTEILRADPALLTRATPPVLVDEWQVLPETWDVVRRAVDDGATPGGYLLTGSASPRPGSRVHTGAGRVVVLRMRPMAMCERGVAETTVSVRGLLEGGVHIGGESRLTLGDYVEEIVASGLPGIRPMNPRARRLALDGYLRRVVDHDVSEQGRAVRQPTTLRLWLTAYAAASSTTATYTSLLDAATAGEADKPARGTTGGYRDALTQLWLLDPVPGWAPFGGELPRLQLAPKHKLADPALAARLLNLSAESLLDPGGPADRRPMLGPLFESLATLTVRVTAQAAESEVGHLRTRNGDHEVDLVVEGLGGSVVGFEVKLSASVTDSDVRHLLWLKRQLGDRMTDAVVLTTGPTAYRRRDGVAVVPLALLGP